MKALLKNAREKKGLKTREVSELLKIDQALVSKFENGLRKPTKAQILKLAALLDIDLETLMTAWLKEKILYELEGEEFALKALHEAVAELTPPQPEAKPDSLEKLFEEMDALKNKMEDFRNTGKFPK